MKAHNYILLIAISLALFSCEALDIFRPNIDININYQYFNLGKVKFINKTVGIDSVKWDFGDDTYSNNLTPEKLYESNGLYRVRFTAFKKKWQFNDSLLISIIDIPKDTLFLKDGLKLFGSVGVREKNTNDLIRFFGAIAHHKTQINYEYKQPYFSSNKSLTDDSLDINFINFEIQNIERLGNPDPIYGHILYKSKIKPFKIIASKSNGKGFIIPDDYEFSNSTKLYKTIVWEVDSFYCDNMNNNFINPENIFQMIQNTPVGLKKVEELNKKEYLQFGEKYVFYVFKSK